MAEKKFDQYAATYDTLLEQQLRGFDREIGYFAKYKVQHVAQLIRQPPENILEYGCGTGRNLEFLRDFFPTAKIFGYDPSAESIKIAHQRNSDVQFISTESLNEKKEEKNQFNLVFLAGVFHHVPIEARAECLTIIRRVMAEGSDIFIFEHNPYNPVTRYMVHTCPFDDDAILLFPKELKHLLQSSGFAIQRIQFTLFFPRVMRILRPTEKFLGWLPLGGQYFIQAKPC